MEKKYGMALHIYRIFSGRSFKVFTLDELTQRVLEQKGCNAGSNSDRTRKYQEEILDALIFLDGQGLIILDPITDFSCINIFCYKYMAPQK